MISRHCTARTCMGISVSGPPVGRFGQGGLAFRQGSAEHLPVRQIHVDIGGKLMPEAFVVTPETTPTPLNVVGEHITLLAPGSRTGSYEIFRQAGPEGSGPPPHFHPWDESFYVVKGEIGPCCMDHVKGTVRPLAIVSYAMRTDSGRPSSSIRFRMPTAMATSVACRPSVCDRNASPITRL